MFSCNGNYKLAWLSSRRNAIYFGLVLKRAQRIRRPFRPILNSWWHQLPRGLYCKKQDCRWVPGNAPPHPPPPPVVSRILAPWNSLDLIHLLSLHFTCPQIENMYLYTCCLLTFWVIPGVVGDGGQLVGWCLIFKVVLKRQDWGLGQLHLRLPVQLTLLGKSAKNEDLRTFF